MHDFYIKLSGIYDIDKIFIKVPYDKKYLVFWQMFY